MNRIILVLTIIVLSGCGDSKRLDALETEVRALSARVARMERSMLDHHTATSITLAGMLETDTDHVRKIAALEMAESVAEESMLDHQTATSDTLVQLLEYARDHVRKIAALENYVSAAHDLGEDETEGQKGP